jgi:predicted regulator of Ras-like GTPase activity (Roadblock/LC7/MglB family)
VARGGRGDVSTQFTNVLDALTKQRGVLASLVVGASDGVTIDSNTQIGQDSTHVAALAASLYRKARKSATAAGLGATGFMQLEAESGRLCIIGGDEIVLIVVAERDANIGLIRVEMLRATKVLA